MNAARVYRTDIIALRPVERRPDGTIRVDAHLTRCGVFQYYQPDGSVRRELRLPEDVHDPESLRSFEGVPVTNEHPPGMLDAHSARQYSVGALLGVPTPDDDHVRGRLAVHDHGTVQAMESGKQQVSLGYVCDTLEAPGVHPQYGPYDAIQKNIRGNHVAIVERARAGVTAAARMDGWQVQLDDDGTPLAYLHESCQDAVHMVDLPTARVEVVVRTDKKDKRSGFGQPIDPDDAANREERGENDHPPVRKQTGATSAGSFSPSDQGKAAKRQPGAVAAYKTEDRGGDVVRGSQPSVGSVPVDGGGSPSDYPDQRLQDSGYDDGDDDDDSYDGMYDGDGKLTPAGQAKIAASSFALPGKQQLPIHDAKSTKKSMKRFGDTPFDSADEKHGAFNRIKSKAKSFDLSTAAFERAHGSKLDRADARPTHEDNMTPEQLKALQEKADKADKRKEKLVVAKEKIDSLEQELAAAQAQVANLTKERDAALSARTDSADVEKRVAERADAKIALLDEARKTGAAVDSKMSVAEIKRAVVKHVDNDDVPADAHEAFLEGVYHGALKRAKKDAADTQAGAGALAGARAAAQQAATQQHLDAGGDDEEAAKARLRSSSREAIHTPSKAREYVAARAVNR